MSDDIDNIRTSTIYHLKTTAGHNPDQPSLLCRSFTNQSFISRHTRRKAVSVQYIQQGDYFSFCIDLQKHISEDSSIHPTILFDLILIIFRSPLQLPH